MLKKLRWHLETWGFLAVSFAVALLPDRAALAAGTRLGRLFFLLLRRRREIAVANIEESLPYLRLQPGWGGGTPLDIARAVFENLGRSVVEDCKIYHGRGKSLIDAVEFRGIEHFEQAKARGKGIAFVTGHCGNWELMALSFGARYESLSVVAREQDNPYLNAVLERIRHGYGNALIYREGALRAMYASFRKNGIVGLLIDQAVHPNDGVLVDFLGRPAWTTNLLPLLARKTKVPMIPIFIHREGGRHVVTAYPEIVPSTDDPDGSIDTARLTACIERYVVEHPAEWYWIHKRWKRT
ncbi:lysophospholipid acyltransferase family protein [Geomonas sp. RF6]|uniref:lysophospholipid acyltransferase family protein n=1 Tax=Geomonas sp. RF6 TaxID=2897342 RepID=UPI001E465F69|nr:lysophospholipid acyltransferase family protein [Geomonas sp. RF6]UFS68635.1 lysophospholipid acyltransferase family protein [Geomonas sp. RF6]